MFVLVTDGFYNGSVHRGLPLGRKLNGTKEQMRKVIAVSLANNYFLVALRRSKLTGQRRVDSDELVFL